MRLAKEFGQIVGWAIIAAASILGLMGLVVAQSAIDEDHRCTDLVHACLYEYEETGKRELELQVGKHRGDVVCDEFRLWFLMLRDDPWPTPYSFAGDNPDFTEQVDEETTCRWVLDPSLYEDLGTIDRVGFEWYPQWGTPRVLGKAILTNVTVPAPGPEPVRVYGEDEEDDPPSNPCVTGFRAGDVYTGQCHSGRWSYFRYDTAPAIGRHGTPSSPGSSTYTLGQTEYVCGTNGDTNTEPGPTNGWYCTGNADHEWVLIHVR